MNLKTIFLCTAAFFLCSCLSAQDYFRLENRWKPNECLHNENGTVESSAMHDGAWSAQWKIIPIGDFYRLENRWKPNECLHNENGKIESGPMHNGAWSAQWKIMPIGDFYRLENRWKANECLHNENGKTESSYMHNGAWSAQWKIEGFKACYPSPSLTNHTLITKIATCIYNPKIIPGHISNYDDLHKSGGRTSNAAMHVQGITYTDNGYFVVNHSFVEGKGILGVSSYIDISTVDLDNPPTLTWTWYDGFYETNHPGAMDAAGNFVAYGEAYWDHPTIPNGSEGEGVKFLEIQDNGVPKRLSHLDVDGSSYGVGLTYNSTDDTYYLLKGGKYLYKSSSCDITNVSTKFEHSESINDELANQIKSESGMPIISISDANLFYAFQLKAGSGFNSDLKASLVNLESLPRSRMIKDDSRYLHLPANTNLIAIMAAASWRYGGGAVQKGGKLFFLWAGRNANYADGYNIYVAEVSPD